jgi:hypothetical protein
MAVAPDAAIDESGAPTGNPAPARQQVALR